mmetsp:Transcript_56895/g.166609  ORF Transcript_56895/g.166609 Transcript_56895/m.166609 type:complete len:560 (+) Transcript_56895:74-1753(+)
MALLFVPGSGEHELARRAPLSSRLRGASVQQCIAARKLPGRQTNEANLDHPERQKLVLFASCAVALKLGRDKRGHRRAGAACRFAQGSPHATLASASPTAKSACPVILSEDGSREFHILMIRRTSDDDVILARTRPRPSHNADVRAAKTDAVAWRRVLLRPSGLHRWTDRDKTVTLTLDGASAQSASLPGIGGHAALDECAPQWPKSVVSELRPWSLKGPGIVVYDTDTFIKNAVAFVAAGQGPVLFPGGAQRLGLPSAMLVGATSEETVSSAWDILGRGKSELPLSYGKMLRASQEMRTGIVDLGQVSFASDNLRSVKLPSRPFGWEYAPRMWEHGAAIRSVDPGGPADKAGCRPGDVIVSANGRWLFDAPLSVVDSLLQDATPPIELEVAQATLAEPLYLREALPVVLRALPSGVAAEDAAEQLLPALQELLGLQVSLTDDVPKVFLGDGGSGSYVHVDEVQQVQMCHVLRGTKFFGVAATPPPRLPGTAEVTLPVNRELSGETAKWLASRHVSLVAAGPGDVLLFWGGCWHFGSNGMGKQACLALFHACGGGPQLG